MYFFRRSFLILDIAKEKKVKVKGKYRRKNKDNIENIKSLRILDN